ncbi:Asp-tRNA(Asn)/Glu-tRNA(Gln) amidotransferase subunit GatA [Acetobacteraceae bacterium]|nr:Asp-tRNA(Asn)/Glu-tRNA(Gln) amidotransferase subunit GatA [Acetobacteraceae bacterium]
MSDKKTNLIDLSLAEARDALAAKKISASELTNAYIDAIETHNPRVNAYLATNFDEARQVAKQSDEILAKGEGKPLTGIPLGIKDLFVTKNLKTTAGSRILENFVPPYESTVSAKLRQDGAIILGKLNMDEFAMGSGNLTSAYGGVENPWKRTGSDSKLVPGGSSGGSAAAVAAGLALGATGSDTGGSIRQPAAFCGIAGVKPTYGRCSRFGMVAFASSLDQAGPMGRDLRDCAIMLKSMVGHDAKDSTSANHPIPDFEKAVSRGVKGLKVGIPKEYRHKDTPKEILEQWDMGAQQLKEAGAEIIEVSLPHSSYGLPTYYIVALAEASSNLSRYDGVRYGERVAGKSLDELYEETRDAGFGDEVKRRILLGTYVLSAEQYDAYYLQAQKVRAKIRQDFVNVFKTVDVLLTPTAPSGAFAWDQEPANPIQRYLNDIFTVPASLAGVPALSLPSGLDNLGVPLGLQLIGNFFDEESILATGGALEKAINFKQRPALWAGNHKSGGAA